MKQPLLLHLAKNQEERDFIKHWSDRAERISQRSGTETTAFLDPGQQKLLEAVCQESDISVIFCGGFTNAERKRGMLIEPYGNAEHEAPVEVLHIQNNRFSKSLTHRDVLGSLLGLGIERSVIGDILVVDSGAYAAIFTEMASFIAAQLDAVGHERVRVELLSRASAAALEVKEHVSVERMTVTSLRLDCILSAAYHLSRSQSQGLIKSGKVKVNYRYEDNLSAQIEPQALLSVRGFGRVKLLEVQGKTKKDRVAIVIGRYSNLPA